MYSPKLPFLVLHVHTINDRLFDFMTTQATVSWLIHGSRFRNTPFYRLKGRVHLVYRPVAGGTGRPATRTDHWGSGHFSPPALAEKVLGYCGLPVGL
jgi:hypothetical protein